MKDIAYYNGKTGPLDEISVPMNDRACYFGDGVYDVSYVFNHVPMAMDEHLDRIYRSAALVDIHPAMTKAEMKEILLSLIRQVDGDSLILYWQLSRGVAPRGHDYSAMTSAPSLWAYVKPAQLIDAYQSYPGITVEDRRFFFCNVKTINLLPNIMANHQAHEHGAEEAIFHRGEQVTEGSHSNIHILKDGALRTAPLNELILPGITRAHVIRICEKLGIPVIEEAFTVKEMMEADEVFFTASGALCCRFDSIDGRPVGGKDMKTFAAIRDAYEEERRRECGLTESA